MTALEQLLSEIKPINWDGSESVALESIKLLTERGGLSNLDLVNLINHCAISCRWIKAHQFLQELSDKLNKEECAGSTTHFLASSSNKPSLSLEAIKFFVESNVLEESSLLWDAVEHRRLDIVKYLIKRGTVADHTSLHLACQQGQMEMIKLLVENGTYIAEKALAAALKYRRNGAIKLLIKGGANIDGIKIKTHKNLALKIMFGSPATSIKKLKKSNEKHLPALLQRLFDKTKVTPYDYLLTCPEWHKAAVMDMISS